MFQIENEKHSDIEDLSFSCGKHCVSSLIKDWCRLYRAYTLEKLQLLNWTACRGEAEGPAKIQVVETSFLIPELGLADSSGTHSIHPPQLQPALLPWLLLASVLQLGVVACLGLVGRHKHTPLALPTSSFASASSAPAYCRLWSLLFVCLMPTWPSQEPSSKLSQS